MCNFVLTIETRAAKTGVKGKPAACTLMMLRAKSPRPLMRFSEKSSGTRCLMLATLTPLMTPVIDLRSPNRYVGIGHCCDPVPQRPGGSAVVQGSCTHRRSARTSTWQVLPSRRSPSPSPLPRPFCFPPFRVQRRRCVRRAGAHAQLCERVDFLHPQRVH